MPLHSFQALPFQDLSGWRMAGRGSFAPVEPGVIESRGGPGLLWYAAQVYENLVLRICWRVQSLEDNSGIFVRCPPLQDEIQPAIDRGYEIQIDERGLDPERNVQGSPYHMTGAIYTVAPAISKASRPIGEWNEFNCLVQGSIIEVDLNGVRVASLQSASREPRGHIALQAHHEGSLVQFKDLRIHRLDD